jgi:hypothetical protein
MLYRRKGEERRGDDGWVGWVGVRVKASGYFLTREDEKTVKEGCTIRSVWVCDRAKENAGVRERKRGGRANASH